MESDKAFAPSTARYINLFHLFFETLALSTFIPEFRCIAGADVCNRKAVFSRVHASIDALLGDTHADAARGRFLLGITCLRLFGLVRHWKQMWINNTFRPVKREGFEKWLFPRTKQDSDSMVLSRPAKIKRKYSKSKKMVRRGRSVTSNFVLLRILFGCHVLICIFSLILRTITKVLWIRVMTTAIISLHHRKKTKDLRMRLR